MEKIELPNTKISDFIGNYKKIAEEFHEKAEDEARKSSSSLAIRIHDMDQKMVMSQEAIEEVLKFGQACFDLGKKSSADESIVFADSIAV